MSLWRYTPLGEAAWLVTCALPNLALANRFALALAQALRAAYSWSVLLGLRSITVRFDPLEVPLRRSSRQSSASACTWTQHLNGAGRCT